MLKCLNSLVIQKEDIIMKETLTFKLIADSSSQFCSISGVPRPTAPPPPQVSPVFDTVEVNNLPDDLVRSL